MIAVLYCLYSYIFVVIHL